MTSLKGKFKFYEDVVEINFSTKFVYFKETLEKMLGLTDDNFSNIKLSYKDEDGDKIEIKTEEDYKIFFDELKKRSDELLMLAEVKEESNISIQQCSVSILAYVQKNNRGNINNVSEQIKEKNKSLELSDEINPNNISNNEKSKDKKEDKKEEKKEDKKEEKNEDKKEDKKEEKKEDKKEEIKEIKKEVKIKMTKYQIHFCSMTHFKNLVN